MQDDGSVFVYDLPITISEFLEEHFGALGSSVSPDTVRALYPGLNDSQVLAAVERDITFRWCVRFLL